MRGYDRVIKYIDDSYDEALKLLEIIPIWIVYGIEYEKWVTRVQDKISQEQADVIAQLIGSSVVEAEVNTYITMEQIKKLVKVYSVDQVKEVLKYFSDNPEKLQTGNFEYLKVYN